MSDVTGSTTVGNPSPTPTPAADPTAQATGAKWYDAIQDQDLRQWVANKNPVSPDQLAGSYRSLEQVFGAEKAGRTIALPGEKAEQAELDAFFGKLGRPESPDKYELPVAEGADKDFVAWAKSTFHKHGLSTKQAAALAKDWEELTGTKMAAVEQERTAKLETDQRALQTEWGQAFEQNVARAKSAAQQFGVKAEVIDALEQSMGYAGVMKFFSEIGAKIGEPGFITPETRQSFATTPANALDEISSLKADKAFQARLIAGDAQAQQRWNRLHEAAYAKR